MKLVNMTYPNESRLGDSRLATEVTPDLSLNLGESDMEASADSAVISTTEAATGNTSLIYTALSTMSRTGTLTLLPGTYIVDENLSIPEGIVLDLPKGVILKPANGVAINNNGEIKAGLYQVFDLSLGGTLSGTPKNEFIYPEWLGATSVEANAATNTTAIQAIVTNGWPIFYSEKYPINAAISLPLAFAGKSMRGKGRKVTGLKQITDNTPVMTVTANNVTSCNFADFCLEYKTQQIYTQTGAIGLYINITAGAGIAGFYWNKFNNIRIEKACVAVGGNSAGAPVWAIDWDIECFSISKTAVDLQASGQLLNRLTVKVWTGAKTHGNSSECILIKGECKLNLDIEDWTLKNATALVRSDYGQASVENLHIERNYFETSLVAYIFDWTGILDINTAFLYNNTFTSAVPLAFAIMTGEDSAINIRNAMSDNPVIVPTDNSTAKYIVHAVFKDLCGDISGCDRLVNKAGWTYTNDTLNSMINQVRHLSISGLPSRQWQTFITQNPATSNRGTFEIGDIVHRSSTPYGANTGWRCVKAGTSGTVLSLLGTIPNGSPTLTVTTGGTGNLQIGDYIQIVGVTRTHNRIIAKSGNTLTLDANSDAAITVPATISWSNPIFTALDQPARDLVFEYFEDFVMQTLVKADTGLVLNKGSHGTAAEAAIDVKARGFVKMITGEDAGGTIAANGTQMVCHMPSPANLGNLVFETKMYIDTSAAGVTVNMGFTDSKSLEEPFSLFGGSCTFEGAADTVTNAGHGLVNGDKVIFKTKVTTTGISLDTQYFVVNKGTDTFQVSLTSGGSAIDLVEDGSGTYDAIHSTATNAACFVYHANSLTDKWFCCAVDTDVDDTTSAETTVAPNTTTKIFRIEISADGATIYFYIDGTLVKTLSGGGVAVAASLYATIVVNALGASPKTVYVDYIKVSHNR